MSDDEPSAAFPSFERLSAASTPFMFSTSLSHLVRALADELPDRFTAPWKEAKASISPN